MKLATSTPSYRSRSSTGRSDFCWTRTDMTFPEPTASWTFTCCRRTTPSQLFIWRTGSGLFTLRFRPRWTPSTSRRNGLVRTSPKSRSVTRWGRSSNMPYLLSEWRAHIQEVLGEYKAASHIFNDPERETKSSVMIDQLGSKSRLRVRTQIREGV